jgi:hypothetical protein
VHTSLHTPATTQERHVDIVSPTERRRPLEPHRLKVHHVAPPRTHPPARTSVLGGREQRTCERGQTLTRSVSVCTMCTTHSRRVRSSTVAHPLCSQWSLVSARKLTGLTLAQRAPHHVVITQRHEQASGLQLVGEVGRHPPTYPPTRTSTTDRHSTPNRLTE